MNNTFDVSRRTFIKQCVVGGVTVYSAPMIFTTAEAAKVTFDTKLKDNWKENGKPQYRFDALEKVTGQKIYGRDYRAKDIEGWPDNQHYAFMLRTSIADRVYLGLDLSELPEDAQPYKIVTSEDLNTNGFKLPEYYGENYLLPKGNTPDYQGQEVAILLFDSFIKFKKAKNRLQFSKIAVQYGEKTALVSSTKDPYASWRVIREENTNGVKYEDIYSTLNNGLTFPSYVDNKPIWPNPVENGEGYGEHAMFLASQISNDINNKENNWHVIDRCYTTQSIEPMMFEAEAFNGWLDQSTNTLHLVVTIQAAQDFHHLAGKVLAESPLTNHIKTLVVHSPYIGGGFGAKDHTIYPYMGIIAAIFAKGPLRMANDRFEQFQSGIKRHPFNMSHKLAFDKETKKVKGLFSDMVIDGGGRINFSSSVTSSGAAALQGIYYIPRNDITAVCYPSAMPHSGSLRGYGTLQTMASMEMMFNEAADNLNVDPIELRKINALQAGQKNTQGAIPKGDIRYLEILKDAEKHDLWKNRFKIKEQYESKNPGMLHGVGFGIVTKNYGTGAAAPSACIEITPEGKVLVDIGYVEMGTGADTSQAVVTQKYLGVIADNVNTSVIDKFHSLKMFETQNPYRMTQEHQDQMSQNPQWTPVFGMASAASMSAHFQTHATEQATRVLFEESLFPAAIEIWKTQYFNSKFAKPDFINIRDTYWIDGALNTAGYPPLPFKLLAMKAHSTGMITTVMTHGLNRRAWATADYTLNGKSKNLPIDGLAVKYGINSKQNNQGFEVINRKNVAYPDIQINNAMVTYYAPCANLVEIAIEKSTGHVQILQTHTWLEPGRVLVKPLLEGQIEGGLAMGIGHALHEYLPSDETGPGTGTWNLNRYKVALAKDVGVWNINYTVLPQLSPSDPPKGIAEVVMIPVVPALIEAIYQATNTRFYHLPVTAHDIFKAL